MFDRDAGRRLDSSHPRCYDSGRLNLDLSLKAVLAWQVNAVLHGIVIYYVGYGAMRHGRGGVYDSGSLGIFGTTLMIVIAVSMNFKAFVSSRTINNVTGGCGEEGGLGPLGFMASHKVVLFFNLAFFFGMSWYASTPACAEDTTAADMMEYWGVTHHTFEAWTYVAGGFIGVWHLVVRGLGGFGVQVELQRDGRGCVSGAVAYCPVDAGSLYEARSSSRRSRTSCPPRRSVGSRPTRSLAKAPNKSPLPLLRRFASFASSRVSTAYLKGRHEHAHAGCAGEGGV